MSMLHIGRAVLVMSVAGLYSTTLWADAAKDAWKKCSRANDSETKIRECTVAVNSGTLSKDVVARALLLRASAYDEKGDYDQAFKDLDQSVTLDPSSSRIVDSRGWEYLRTFDYKKAIEDFDRSIQLDPKNDHAYQNRGIARFLSGDFAEAENDFAISEGFTPKPRRAYPLANRILAHLRNAAGKGIKPDIGSIEIHANLTEWPGQIIAYYTGAISSEAVLHAAEFPYANWKLCQAYFYLGEHALIEGNREEALEFLQKSIDTEARSDAEHAMAEAELRNLRGLANGASATLQH